MRKEQVCRTPSHTRTSRPQSACSETVPVRLGPMGLMIGDVTGMLAVVAIVALSVSLAVTLSYGIVWLVLVPLARPMLAVALGALTLAELLLLIYWCLPRPWWRS